MNGFVLDPKPRAWQRKDLLDDCSIAYRFHRAQIPDWLRTEGSNLESAPVPTRSKLALSPQAHLREAGVQTETLIQPGNWRGFPVSRAPIEYYESVAKEAGLAFEAVGETNKTGWRPGRRPPKPPAVMAKNPRRLMLLALRHPS